MKKEICRFQQFSANDRFELQMIPLKLTMYINKESQVTLLLAIRYSVHLVGQQIHGKPNKKSKKESQEGNSLSLKCSSRNFFSMPEQNNFEFK